MKAVSLASSYICRSVDADVWCKPALKTFFTFYVYTFEWASASLSKFTIVSVMILLNFEFDLSVNKA